MNAPAKPASLEDATGLLTMGQVAALLGCTGRRPYREAKRRLLRVTGGSTEILIRTGTREDSPRYLVAAAALRDLLPQLISKRDQLASDLREEFAELHSKIDDLTEQMELRFESSGIEMKGIRQRLFRLENPAPRTAQSGHRGSQG